MYFLEVYICIKYIYVIYNGKSGISGVGFINKYFIVVIKFLILIIVLI